MAAAVADPDPGLVHAERFRVLPRTDGAWIVYDPQLPLGRRTVGGRSFLYSTEAADFARELAAAASKAPS